MDTFSKSGFLARIQPNAAISQFQVLGERSSGTNFTKRLLGRNTNLTPTEALGWKHGFPHAAGIPPDLVVIAVVRRADDWARSMHAKPWHCTPELQQLAFSEFIRADWDTIVDRPRYFEGAARAGIVGHALQYDRHPLTGQRFGNVFALRQAKLAGLLSYLDRDCSFILLRMEELTLDPEVTLDRICSALNSPRGDDEYRPVRRRLGAKFRASVPDRPATPSQFPPEDLMFLKSAVNSAQETALGYRY